MILGLTGSLGSGKSTVARMLEEQAEARIVDADEIAREVQKPGGSAFDEIVAAFGPSVLQEDGMLDRKKLATLVFADDNKRHILNSIVHPKVRAEELRMLREYRQLPLVVLVVPLLLENRMQSLVDRIVVVTVDDASRRKRLYERSAMTDGDINRCLAAQMSDEEKVAQADFVIDNSGSLDNTRRQVDDMLLQLKVQSPQRN
jgi:dephospho-CoA kinase